MPTYYARKAGNINASDVWATTPSGTAAAVTFVAGDVLMANSFAITVNVSTDLGATGQVRNDTTGGATAGGSFALANGVTLTANVFAAGTCVTFSGGASAFIVGNCTGGTANNSPAVNNASSGTLSITGHCTGGLGANAFAANNASSGTLSITGSCTGGAGSNTSVAVNNASTGILTVDGICTGGPGAFAFGAVNSSTGTMLITGVIQASEFNAGVGGTNRAQVTLLTGPFLISPTFGVNPIACTAWRWASALNNQTYLEVGTQTLLQKRNLVTPDNATNFPAASNVRSGITYGIGGVVSGTCIVPNPAQVAAGTPVDNTVGTLASPSASDIANAVWGAATRSLTSASIVRTELATELARIDAPISSAGNAPSASTVANAVWGAATRTITGGTVDTLVNAPTVPTPAQIASQVRSELSVELGRVDQPISTRATPANIPTADITAIKARTDQLNPTRLGQVTTTEILGNLLAQANS